ncbi:tetratricopeptide repeat protein [Micromonospora sp. NPDC005220]|uniref:tetratricopeptide repeat protein n=1 Tax=Micromonospora sp. NPDC005220 TaxID=3155589 RepID=UPI0033A0EDEF
MTLRRKCTTAATSLKVVGSASLVYDNADDPHELAPLMPSSNLVGERGHVLVTSRNMAWSASAMTLDVDVFTRAESVELLLKRRPATTPDDARRLAAELGDLPLALEQAASWLLTMLSSVDEYLVDLKEHARELLGEGQPRQYRGTVLTVVSMALAAVREQNPAAAQLIEVLSFLSPDPIPMRLLWEGRRAGLDEPLRTSLPAVTEGSANYRLVTRRFGTDHVLTAEAAMTCANAMRAAGDATQAYALASQGHATFRAVFGERHPVTLCAAVNLGVILRARNFDREARELGAATLEAMGEALPPTHPYLLSARSAQAINLVRSHRLEQAQVLSEAILADSRRLRGPGHPYTLYCAVNAAVDLIEVGEEVRGRELLDEAAAALESMFGADHPEVDAARGQRRIECDIETVGLT